MDGSGVDLLTEPQRFLGVFSAMFSLLEASQEGRPTVRRGELDSSSTLHGKSAKEFAAMFYNRHRWILFMVYPWVLK